MATFDTWGGSWGSAWAETWFRSDVAVQIGGGGGGPLDMGEESPPFKRIIEEREPADRFRHQRERHARLREQLRVALEGPQAEEVRALVEPRPVDSPQPLHERIDFEAISAEIRQELHGYYQRAQAYRREQARVAREREEDDMDAIAALRSVDDDIAAALRALRKRLR